MDADYCAVLPLGSVVNSILRALGASTQGTVDMRRRILRMQIGLKADPV